MARPKYKILTYLKIMMERWFCASFLLPDVQSESSDNQSSWAVPRPYDTVIIYNIAIQHPKFLQKNYLTAQLRYFYLLVNFWDFLPFGEVHVEPFDDCNAQAPFETKAIKKNINFTYIH